MSVEDGIPEQGQAPQTHDWEKDYKALQAEYTRSQQALKEQEGVWEDDETLAARLRERKPHWFETDEEEDTYEEPDEPAEPKPDPRVDQLVAREAERQYEADLTEALGDETVPARAKDWIKDRTAALGNNKKALTQAVEEFRELTGEIRGPQRREAPTPPQPGKAGEKKYDPRNKSERRARMAAAIEGANQQQ